MTSRSYFGWALAIATSMLVVIALVNRVVDPLWYFGDIEIPGFNADKTRFADYVRHVKPALLARLRPEVVVLGSSYAEMGFRPDNGALTEGGALRGYNFAVAGAEWPRIYCGFEYLLRHANPKRILLGISPTPMPVHDCARDLAAPALRNVAGFLLSWDVFRTSLRTVADQGRRPATHTRDGVRLLGRGTPGTEYRFRHYLEYHRHSLCAIGDPAERFEATRSPAPPGAEPPVDLSGLREIVRTARSQGMELWLVAYPVHAYLSEIEFLCGRAGHRWAVLGQIAEMIEQEGLAGSPQVQLWDFAGYNPILGERLSSGAMKWWTDPDHFNYEIGDMVLSQIRRGAGAAGNPGLPGERLTTANLRASFERVVRERTEYVTGNAWFLPELKAVLPKEALQQR